LSRKYPRTDPEPTDTSTPVEADRRRFPRHPVEWDVCICCRRGAVGMGPDLALDVLDVSATGIRLLLQAPLARGQCVEVILEGPGEGLPARHLGRVVWSVPVAGGRCCIGVQFDQPLSCPALRALTS
jgi:hypothetical protein